MPVPIDESSPVAELLPRRSAARRARGRGDAAEVLEEVRHRLAVGPEHDELVAKAALDAWAGRRPRW